MFLLVTMPIRIFSAIYINILPSFFMLIIIIFCQPLSNLREQFSIELYFFILLAPKLGYRDQNHKLKYWIKYLFKLFLLNYLLLFCLF